MARGKAKCSQVRLRFCHCCRREEKIVANIPWLNPHEIKQCDDNMIICSCLWQSKIECQRRVNQASHFQCHALSSNEFKTSSHFESLAQSFQPIQLILLSLSLSGAVTSGNSNVLRHRERERERMKLVLCVVGTLPLKLSEVGGTEVCKFPLSVFCGLLVSRILLHCPSHLWVFRCLSFKQPVWCLSNTMSGKLDTRKLRGHACK